MKNYIKYEELSQNVKAEIEKYFQEEKKKNNQLILEEAMFQWFDDCFDKWIKDNYESHERDDKRKYYRLGVEIPVRIVDTLIESSREETDAIEFIGTILNISRGGLYFKSKKYIEASSIIKVKIDLRTIDEELKNVEALAMVLRSDKLDKNEYGVGLMFSSIYDEHKENLNIFILRNIAHHINLF